MKNSLASMLIISVESASAFSTFKAFLNWAGFIVLNPGLYMKKIYIGGLPYKVTSEMLAEEFGQYGEIEDSIVISDRATGRSRGFGFVTFASEQAANASLAHNGREWMGRTLTVNMAKERDK
ncbi:MAG: RNA-binding protein [Gammaproteobacteria bacterium]